MENIELWSQEGEVGWDEVGEEGRPGPPSNVLSLCSVCIFSLLFPLAFPLLFVLGGTGEKEKGGPQCIGWLDTLGVSGGD